MTCIVPVSFSWRSLLFCMKNVSIYLVSSSYTSCFFVQFFSGLMFWSARFFQYKPAVKMFHFIFQRSCWKSLAEFQILMNNFPFSTGYFRTGELVNHKRKRQRCSNVHSITFDDWMAKGFQDPPEDAGGISR